MPSSAFHPCGPGCAVLLPHGVAHCPVHTPNPAFGWSTDTGRIRGRRLQALRAQLFAREPLCRLCHEAGRLTVATIRDHIVPRAEGGTDDPTNIQPLCQSCSDLKTQREATGGRQSVQA